MVLGLCIFSPLIEYRGREANLTSRLHLETRLRMKRIIPQLPIRFHGRHKNNFTWSVSVYVFISFRVIYICTFQVITSLVFFFTGELLVPVSVPVDSGDTSLQYVAVAFSLSRLKESCILLLFYTYNICSWCQVIKCGHAQITLKQGVNHYVRGGDNNMNTLRQLATLHKTYTSTCSKFVQTFNWSFENTFVEAGPEMYLIIIILLERIYRLF